MSYCDLDLSACMSRQPRPVPPLQEDTSYKTEDLSQYMARPVKEKEVQVEEPQQETTEAAEVSVVSQSQQSQSQSQPQPNNNYNYNYVGFTPYTQLAPNELAWRRWVMKTKALSKEYKLVLFESWISQLE